ncbi:MAG: hypothetical protein IJ157_02065 [Clostridia bacterium]|nr:hypothetical protein [Clostridia bacterium]
MSEPNASPAGISAREHLRDALLRGDRGAAEALAGSAPFQALIQWKNELLRELTAGYLAGRTPFCQLTAAAQAACAFYEDAPPIACCGGAAGSATGQQFMLMLLRAWGIPALALGEDASADEYLLAIREHGLRFAVCVLFSPDDLADIESLAAAARQRGMRDSFRLVICGARLEGAAQDVDFYDHRAAAAAQWMENAWRS